jgi:hypothetical protein
MPQHDGYLTSLRIFYRFSISTFPDEPWVRDCAETADSRRSFFAWRVAASATLGVVSPAASTLPYPPRRDNRRTKLDHLV